MTSAQKKAGRAAPSRKPSIWRRVAMWSLPVVLVTGGALLWLFGGRYVSTDDAYIKRDKLLIGAEVSGRILTIGVGENMPVKAGSLLFALDPEPFEISLARREAAVEAAKVRVRALIIEREQAMASLAAARADLALAKETFARIKALLARGNAPQARLDEATAALERAREGVRVASKRLRGIEATLGPALDQGVDAHPWVREAVAESRQARWQLEQTKVYAPFDGIVVQTGRLLKGTYLPAGLPALTLLADANIHIVANFKETELTHMRPGQRASVSIDAYPKRAFDAVVESIGWGTGSEFSLLPPENATGNWVKVVQRVPVRLRFRSPPPMSDLRSGLSLSVEVDTGIGPGERLRTTFAALGLR